MSENAYAPMYGWERYLYIEQEFLNARQYISFEIKGAYSDFFARCIILLGAEVEAAMKQLCAELDSSNAGNISDYKKAILSHFPNIVNFKVRLLCTDEEIAPFHGWDNGQLSLWNTYTDVKHSLSIKQDATLKNALDILAAYQILIFVIQAQKNIKTGNFNKGTTATEAYAFSLINQPKLLIPMNVDFDVCQSDENVDFYLTFNVTEMEKFLKQAQN